MKTPTSFFFSVALFPLVDAFQSRTTSPSGARSFLIPTRHAAGPILHAKKKEDGMEAAFRALDNLDSLDSATTQSRPIELPEKGLPTKASAAATPEDEVKLYSEMYKEMEDEGQTYSDVLADMGHDSKQVPTTLSTDEDTADATTTTDEFMQKAFEEALAEAKKKAPGASTTAESILDNKEIMKEIEEIFEKGNEKLLASIEEIRQEQRNLAQKDAKRSSKEAIEKTAEDAQRLAMAEASMDKLLKNVDKERLEVEKAVADLQKAKEEVSSDSLLNLKEGGVLKQVPLVGAVLFGIRAATEILAFVGDGGSGHLTAALVQGGIALACALFLVLS